MATQRKFLVSAVLVSLVSVLALTSPPARAAGPDDDVQEIQKAIELSHQQAVQVINKLNVLDPSARTSPSPGSEPSIQTQTQIQIGNPSPPSGGQNAMEAVSPEVQAQLDRVQSLLNNPMLQKYLRIFSDPEVQRDAQKLLASPQRLAFLGWEAGFVIFMLGFKTWLTLKNRKSLFAVIFVQIWTLAIFIVGVTYVLPRCVFGPDYAHFAESFWSALTR
jgi:hypothetical protein